jgi:hypothetical protein
VCIVSKGVGMGGGATVSQLGTKYYVPRKHRGMKYKYGVGGSEAGIVLGRLLVQENAIGSSRS